MIDLAAERAEAADRREKRDAETWLNMRARRLRLEGKGDTLEQAARAMWPDKTDEDRSDIVARASEQLQEREMAKKDPDDLIIGKDMVRLGAQLLEREAGLTSREVYRRLAAEHGAERLGVSEATWINGGYGTDARRMAQGLAPHRNRKKAERKKRARTKTDAAEKQLKKPAGSQKHRPGDDHPWRQRATAEVAAAEKVFATPTEEPSGAERPGEAASAGAEAEPVASPASVGPISSGTVTSSMDRAQPRPIVVVHPGATSLQVESDLREAGYIVVVSDQTDAVRVIDAAALGVSADAITRAAMEAIKDTPSFDVRDKFARYLATALLAGSAA
jgi:hypothetical protein